MENVACFLDALYNRQRIVHKVMLQLKNNHETLENRAIISYLFYF
jgi:hypothetical protein